jgi:putative RNA 2'-phosphotransferase
MKHRHTVTKLSKMLVYVLGRQPDAFGLIPDAQGYVKVKDLLKALGEEPCWRHVRSAHIREVGYSIGAPPVETKDNLIRAVDRSRLPSPEIPADVPKLLYYPVRRRAYPVVLEKGLRSTTSGRRIILADDRTLAQRLGRRIDPSPVILTVNSAIVRKKGAALMRFGQHLFLSDILPSSSLHGPPLPTKKPEPKKTDAPQPTDAPKTPGAYTLDLTIDPIARKRALKESGRRKNEWERDRKRRNRKNEFP